MSFSAMLRELFCFPCLRSSTFTIAAIRRTVALAHF